MPRRQVREWFAAVMHAEDEAARTKTSDSDPKTTLARKSCMLVPWSSSPLDAVDGVPQARSPSSPNQKRMTKSKTVRVPWLPLCDRASEFHRGVSCFEATVEVAYSQCHSQCSCCRSGMCANGAQTQRIAEEQPNLEYQLQ
eukprot:6467675-Amphidinium_carterae.1